MLVSRKNLSLIHFVPAEAAASGDVAKSSHEGVYFLPIARLGSELQQPFSKCRVERPPLGTGHLTGLFNEVFVGTEGDVLHTKSVYTKTVLPRPSKISHTPCHRPFRALCPEQVLHRLPHHLAADVGDGLGERNIFRADLNAIL